VDAAVEAGLAPIVAVVPRQLAAATQARVTFLPNAEPELGMSHSLRLGVAAMPADAEAAVILLGDQPTIGTELLQRLLAARGVTPFVATRVAGMLAPPVLVERSHFDLVQQPRGDIGLRQILRSHAELVTAIEVARMPADIDTVADLRAIGGA
jgi:CTP:molybdopterin cytidylyltransferase MocA